MSKPATGSKYSVLKPTGRVKYTAVDIFPLPFSSRAPCCCFSRRDAPGVQLWGLHTRNNTTLSSYSYSSRRYLMTTALLCTYECVSSVWSRRAWVIACNAPSHEVSSSSSISNAVVCPSRIAWRLRQGNTLYHDHGQTPSTTRLRESRPS